MSSASSYVDLSISIGKIFLKNPVMLASGTAGFGFEFAEIFDISQIGGIATKTITSEPREGNPPPRIFETPSGMINSIGLANPGIDKFMGEIAPRLKNLPTRIILSVGGTSIDDFKYIVETVSEISSVDAIELNLSCPNVKEGGIHFSRSAETISRLLSELRLITEKPLWAKLSPQVTDIVELGTAAADSGADAIVVINTLPAMAIDIETKKPRLGAITGGLSGSAIHPVAVAMIYALHSAVDIPIIGVGGISSTEDAIELMLAGATALQIGSSAFADTNLPLKIIDGIGKYCRRQRFSSAREIVGAVEI